MKAFHDREGKGILPSSAYDCRKPALAMLSHSGLSRTSLIPNHTRHEESFAVRGRCRYKHTRSSTEAASVAPRTTRGNNNNNNNNTRHQQQQQQTKTETQASPVSWLSDRSSRSSQLNMPSSLGIGPGKGRQGKRL